MVYDAELGRGWRTPAPARYRAQRAGLRHRQHRLQLADLPGVYQTELITPTGKSATRPRASRTLIAGDEPRRHLCHPDDVRPEPSAQCGRCCPPAHRHPDMFTGIQATAPCSTGGDTDTRENFDWMQVSQRAAERGAARAVVGLVLEHAGRSTCWMHSVPLLVRAAVVKYPRNVAPFSGKSSPRRPRPRRRRTARPSDLPFGGIVCEASSGAGRNGQHLDRDVARSPRRTPRRGGLLLGQRGPGRADGQDPVERPPPAAGWTSC